MKIKKNALMFTTVDDQNTAKAVHFLYPFFISHF
jgi:hypothetical protein